MWPAFHFLTFSLLNFLRLVVGFDEPKQFIHAA